RWSVPASSPRISPRQLLPGHRVWHCRRQEAAEGRSAVGWLRRLGHETELRHQSHGVVILATVDDLPSANPSEKAELHLDLAARRRDRTGRSLKGAVLPSACDRLDNCPVT